MRREGFLGLIRDTRGQGVGPGTHARVTVCEGVGSSGLHPAWSWPRRTSSPWRESRQKGASPPPPAGARIKQPGRGFVMPKEFREGSLSFNYPDSWEVEREETDNG